jgi:hypothetical protein
VGKIKARLTDQIAQPIAINVEGYGELLIHPLLLEEQATIDYIQREEKNLGKATLYMLWFCLRKIEPEITRDDINNMNLTLKENIQLVAEIDKVMVKFASFRSSSPAS